MRMLQQAIPDGAKIRDTSDGMPEETRDSWSEDGREGRKETITQNCVRRTCTINIRQGAEQRQGNA